MCKQQKDYLVSYLPRTVQSLDDGEFSSGQTYQYCEKSGIRPQIYKIDNIEKAKKTLQSLADQGYRFPSLT